MAYEIIGWKNKGETGAKPINRDNLRHMDNGILNLDTYKAEIMPLLTVSDTAPVECERGDLYYNTTTELIYVATQPDTWSEEGTTPSIFNLYVDLSSSKLYYYDGTNFNSYGSGGGGETLPVGTELDFDGVSQDIPTGWEEVNNPDSYSTSEVKTNKVWIDGKPIYRKVIVLESGTIHAGYYEYNHNISNLDKTLNIYGMCYSSTQQHPIQRVVPDEIAKWGIGLGDINQSTFALHFGTGYQDINLVYIVIEYTKTTD